MYANLVTLGSVVFFTSLAEHIVYKQQLLLYSYSISCSGMNNKIHFVESQTW